MLDALKQQTISWANIDPGVYIAICRHEATVIYTWYVMLGRIFR